MPSINELIRLLLTGPDALRKRLIDISQQLERMEDKISRIEDGLETAGFLSKESRLKERHLDPTKLSLEESFDYIYLHRLWGANGPVNSGTGSYGSWADKYVELVKEFIRTRQIKTMTDIGCGDFNIGSQICPQVDRYNALDVSREIIRHNTERFKELTQVKFRQANACVDPLPPADLAVIRQVLQHLTNEQIEAILQNVARTGFRFVMIAEHQPADDKLVKANMNLPTQSNSIRAQFGSGIYPDQPPFSRPMQRIAQFEGEGGQLAIYLWDLSKNPSTTNATS